MRILVTGGAGFIGSVLCEKLRKSGHQVVIWDRFVHQDSESFAFNLENSGCVIERIDLSNFEMVRNIERKEFEVVFHLAANSDVRPDNQTSRNRDFYDTLATTLSLLESCKDSGVKKFIFASTSAVFGEVHQPIEQDLHQKTMLKPISEYGIAKLSSEYLCETFSKRLDSTQVCVLRFPNVVGRNSTHGILFDFFTSRRIGNKTFNILGNGKQEKPYINVDDLVIVLELLMQQEWGGLRYLNLGPSDTITVKRITEIFLNMTGWKVTTVFGSTAGGWQGDVPKYSYVPNEFSPLLGSSESAIKKAVADLMQDPRFI